MTKHNTTIDNIEKKLPFNELFRELYPEHYKGHSSLCPFHDDARNSFEVHEDHGYCHAGCRPENGSKSFDQISLWMQAKQVDFKSAIKQLAEKCGICSEEKTTKRKLGPIVRVYEYLDESGQKLFANRRHNPKDFTQAVPDGKGGWTSKKGCMEGVRRVVFGLPELLAADPKEPVLMVEGEKDALSGRSLEFVATTSPQGADKNGSKWPGLVEKYAIHEPLKDRIVWIIPDNDEAGREHARAVARTLCGFATSVRILELPGLPEKGDLSDFIDQHGQLEAKRLLLELAEKTPEYEPASDEVTESDTGPNLTDMGNAQRLAGFTKRRTMFCKQLGGWHNYDGVKWTQDQCSQVMARAKEMVNSWYDEAAKITDQDRQDAFKKHARQCESAARINAMIHLLPAEPGISVLSEVFDQDSTLLNVRNGTLNLRTGELKPHNADDLITRLAPVDYDPGATCPRWEQFILEIMDDDKELASYLQRVLGYSVTGLAKEQAWFFLWGKGSNGKSVFINAVSEVLGDYAVDTPAATFMEKKGDDGPRNDLARLRARRFVSASEPRGARFDPETIKKVSGDGKITARFLHKEFFEFTPESKVFICANNRPEVRDSSEAFWRRIQLIPFTRQFTGEDRDNDLPEKLRAEAPGILHWMIEGCRAWQETGLNAPDKVKLAVEEYRSDADVLANFLDEDCVMALSASVPVSKLYEAYQASCEDSGQHPLSRTRFNENLLGRAGISKGRSGSASHRVKVWRGIGLRSETEGNVTHADFSRPIPERSCSVCDIPPTACPKPLNNRNAAQCKHFTPSSG
ncbi:MAG: phage/plasmid primase, P4 family [Desulfomonilaceae bacterium]